MRAFAGVEYVMSHLRLAELYEARGDRGAAGEHYAAFLGLWGEGDMERERLDHARAFLAES